MATGTTSGLRPTIDDSVTFANSGTTRTIVRLNTNASISSLSLTKGGLRLNIDQPAWYTLTVGGSVAFGSHTTNVSTAEVTVSQGALYVGGSLTLARSVSSTAFLTISGGNVTVAGALVMTGGASTQATLTLSAGNLYVGSLNGNTAAVNNINWTGGTLSILSTSGLGFINAGTGTLRLAGDNATGGVYFYNASNFYTQSASGTTVIEIKGTGQSINTTTQTFTGDYDYAYFSGASSAVTLNGTIYLDIIDGYELQGGDTFNLVYASSITLVDTLTLTASEGVDVSKFTYDVIDDVATGGKILQLTYVPEPALACVLGAVAALALVLRRRRR